MVNAPVARPIRSEKRALMIPGTNTFPIAIPAPSRSVPKKSPPFPANERITMPTRIAKTAKRSVFPAPSASLMRRTNGDKTANIISGIVVSKPKTPLLNGSSAFMDDTSGPTAVIGARRFAATKTNPKNNNRLKSLFFILCSIKAASLSSPLRLRNSRSFFQYKPLFL